MRLLFSLLLILTAGTLQAQPENPLYWKARKPHPGYWQQDVRYSIDARIDETDHIITAKETLGYTNNSPDTLRWVFFHLYQNAFVQGSHLHSLEEAKNIPMRLGRYETAGLGTTIRDLRVDGASVQTELDNTILKVYLPRPLLPGATCTFSMDFSTYFDQGATRRRMKMWDAWGFMHYNGCQWFPKISVYDAKFGWDTYQHLGKEFYGDFGTWDISLDFPSNYVVEATGALQNRDEVLPAALREKLDLKNFKDKKWDEAPSIITPYVKGERKVWKYHAENVHDFAWTADPSYRIATTSWNGIECVGLAQEPHASGWQNSAAYVAKIIRTFSEDIGPYAYPKMVAADAQDGMEYPMLTLDGGRDPGYRGLLVHEIGHNWFYGMVGSNETYRAALDEGFTQFLTAWGMRRLEGDPQPIKAKGFFKRGAEGRPTIDARVLTPYTMDALNRDEVQLNTHSDDFGNALGHEGGYRGVYYKTASMLYNLQYVLGDSLFQAALQHYFGQWKFAHPYFDDFRQSVIRFTHVDLNWFFDEWLETTKTVDYSVSGIRRVRGTDSVAIRFRRKGASQMPVDFTVQQNDGSLQSYSIPNTWFAKSSGAAVLPKWYGWGQLHERYTARVAAPAGVREVRIDTSFRLGDAAWLDNARRPGLGISSAVRTRLDRGIAVPADRRYYRLWLRPDLWWNPIDGVKAGIHAEGSYLNLLHNFDATVWYNTRVGIYDAYVPFRSEGYYQKYAPISYTFNYRSPVSRALPKLQLDLHSRFLDGLQRHSAGLIWSPNARNTLSASAQTLWRPVSFDLDYLNYPNEWDSRRARPNSSVNLAWTHLANHKRGASAITLSARAPFLAGRGSDAFNYGWGQLDAVNQSRFGKLGARGRLFARYGAGTSIPSESALWLAGANPETQMENKYTRSIGFVPDAWRGFSSTDVNHFQQGGGLNLRGYAGYLVADERNGEILIGYKGRSGAAANLELDFGDYLRIRPRLTRNWLHADLYLFADAGVIELNRYTSLSTYWQATPASTWSAVRADAGVGTAVTVKRWGRFDKAAPLTLRFDVPAVLSHPPAGTDHIGFRYVVGVGRSF